MSTDVMTDASSRKLSCKRQEARAEAVLGRLGRQEARREAVLGARRPGGRPSWTPDGPSGGRLGRQEAHPEAALGARRPVRRVLGRQEAKSSVKMQFFLASVL